MGPDPPGELGNPTDEITFLNVSDASSLIFTSLTPNSPYEVVICARTNTGCGVNFIVNQTTDEDGKQYTYTILDLFFRNVHVDVSCMYSTCTHV